MPADQHIAVGGVPPFSTDAACVAILNVAAPVPAEKRDTAHPSHRVLAVDGRDYDLARGRGTVGLHTRLYEDILSGGGFGLADARPAVALADQIRRAAPARSQAPR